MKKIHYVDNYIVNPYHKVTVSVIGVGGTGSQVLTSLGRINHALVRLGHPGLHVTAYDDDIVTDANCGRQLFSVQEIGLNKADTLITKLNYFFGTDWESVPARYDGKHTSNITITCVDTASARLQIAAILKDSNATNNDMSSVKYWLDMGNLADRGQIVLGTAFKTLRQPSNTVLMEDNNGKKKRFQCVENLKCVNELFNLDHIDDTDNGPSCSLAEALSKQDLFINSTIANFGCALLWRMFRIGILDIQGAYVNLSTMRVNPMVIS